MNRNMDFIRKQLYLYALQHRDIKMSIPHVKQFILKYKKFILHSTLLMEFLKVCRIKNLSNIIDPDHKLPVDIMYLIIKQTGF